MIIQQKPLKKQINRTILHSDVNNFFASVECATKPELKNKPVAVTGNPQKRTGIILAKNEVAKNFGVKTGDAIWQAQKCCPNLITLPPHYALYEKISKQLHQLYLQYTDFVEPLGLDECWLDVTPSLKYLKKSGKEIADEIRQRVKAEFGFTVSVGVSFSKIYAKLGSDMKKPDATTEITFENYKEITQSMPLNSILGIGSKLSKKFEKINVNTIGEYVNLPQQYLQQNFGKTAVELQQKLNGQFEENVANYFHLAPPKSIGNGTTTILDIIKREDICKVVMFLSEKIANRLWQAGYCGRCVSFTLKTSNFQRIHHSYTISAVQTQEEIFANAMKLIDRFWDYSKPIRAIRVKISSLQNLKNGQQLSFFTKKQSKIGMQETIIESNLNLPEKKNNNRNSSNTDNHNNTVNKNSTNNKLSPDINNTPYINEKPNNNQSKNTTNTKREQQKQYSNTDAALNDSIQKIKQKYGKDKIYIASDTAPFINRKNEDEGG